MINKRTTLTIAAALLASTLAGCSVADSAASDDEGLAAGEAVVVTDDAATTTVASDSVTVAAETEANAETHETVDDYTYDEADIIDITLGTAIVADADSVTVDGTTATITTAGTYRVSGVLADGGLVVDAGDGTVRIILDDADISNADGAAIAVMSAGTAVVVLAEGSTNTLTDGAAYDLPEGEDEPNAALYSAADLTITGEGALSVSGNYNDGIASKDGLIIDSGAITVVAVDDGIRGKDYVVIDGGDLDVISGGDGIKSDNEEDPERGYITIAAGEIDVISTDDGVQAVTDVLITGGTLTISAGEGAATDESGRGIQGDVSVVVSGGTITADAVDDAIHSNSSVTIDDGSLTLASGDDAIHGDFFVTINGGTIIITESFEGIESEVITINDGFIDLAATDDGLNVADGTAAATDAVAAGGGPGAGGPGGGEEAAGDYYIYINGGTLSITIDTSANADGDGIDSNGNVVMTGGVVAVSGPIDTRNSAVDASGSFEVSGGLLIGTHIDGRNSEGVGTGSTQASVYLTSDSVIEAGTVVHIQTTDGQDLVTFQPVNEFDVIVFTSPDLVAGDTYEIYLGGTVSGDSATGLYEADAYDLGTLAGTATAG